MYTPNEEMIIALRKRNFAGAEAALQAGADINGKNPRGETAAYFFADNASLPMLEWLIVNGADLNIPNDDHETPLFKAVSENEVKAVDLLLNAGADVNIPNKRLIAPLLQSVLNAKDYGVFERILEAGPDLDAVSENQTSAVLAAAGQGKTQYVTALLQAGADPETTDQLGLGLLHAAVHTFKPEVLRAVLDNAPNLDPNYVARSGSTPMSWTLGVPEMTSMLLDIGGDPNAKVVNKMYEGMSLLMSVLQRQPSTLPQKQKDEDPQNIIAALVGAAGNGNDLVQRMLDKGADPTHRTNDGTNSAYHAISSGAVDALPLLVAKGLDPKRPVAANSFLPYDILVFQKGVDLDAPETLELIEQWHSMGFPFERPEWDEEIDGQWTAAHDAAYAPLPTVLANFLAAGFIDGIKTALNLNADPNEIGQGGGNLAHALVNLHFDGMSQRFKVALQKALKSRKLDDATKKQQKEEIEAEAKAVLDDLLLVLENTGLDWNVQNKEGNTPLHLAAMSDDLTWAKYLLTNRKVNPTVRNKEGLTPAGAALKAGNLGMFTALSTVAAEQGYDLRSTAIVDTVQASDDDFRVRQPWLRAMASVEWTEQEKEALNADGQSGLYVAAATQQQDVTRTLLKMGLNPNTQSPSGNTPLMEAAFTEDGEIIRLLRAAGASLNTANSQGQTVHDVSDYVKSLYVHKALSSDDLGELIQDLANHPLTDDEKMMAAYANANVENTVRFFKDEKPLEIELNKTRKQGIIGVQISDPHTQKTEVYGDMTPEVQEDSELEKQLASAQQVLNQAQQQLNDPTPTRRSKGP